MKLSELEKQVNSLKDAGIVLSELLPVSDVEEYDADKIIKIIEAGYSLDYDEDSDVLYYVDENGDRHIAPDLSEGMSESAEWLSDKLPQPITDFDQGGNLRKSEEAKSEYILVCIAAVIQTFKTEIIEVLKNYDYNERKFKDNYNMYTSLTSYLKTFQDLNSVRINSVISSAGIRISRVSEKKDAYWRISLSAEEISEYSKVSRSIKNVILRYELYESLSPSEIKKLSKIERLNTIDKRDREIERIIDECAIPTLFRISKFNSERLPAVAKRKIYLASRKVANEAVRESGKEGMEANEVYDSQFALTTKELTRMAVSTLRYNEIVKFKNNPSEYVLRKKV